MKRLLVIALAAAMTLFTSCTEDDLRETILWGTWEGVSSTIDYGNEVKDRSDWVAGARIHFDSNGTGWSNDFLNYDIHLCTEDDASFFQHVDERFTWTIKDGELIITSSNKLVRTIKLDLLSSEKITLSYLLSDKYQVVVTGKRTGE